MAVVNTLSKGMAPLGIASGVIAVGPTESLITSAELWPDAALFEPVALSGRGDVRSMAQVFAIARRTRARAVLVHSHRHATPLALGRMISGQPLNMVTVEHHSLGLRAPSDNVNSASALLWSKASVFLTEDYLVGYPLKSSKLRGLRTRAVIANGVDLAPFSLGQRRPRSVEKIPILGMAARLVPSKNVDTILDAVVILAEAQSSKTPHLRLAGDGPERSRLESRVTELGIGDYVSFLGHVPESQLPTFFSGLDIYVLSTMGEAFNTSLLQAAAAQVPIVATRVPGVTDLFTDGVDAILVEPRDPWSLTAAILEAADPVVAHRIAKAAFELVSSRYTASSMVRAYLRLLVRVDPNGPWLKSEGRMGGEPGMWNAT